MAGKSRRGRDGGSPIVSPNTFRRLRKRADASLVVVVFVRETPDGGWSASAEAGHDGTQPTPQAFEAAVNTIRALAGNVQPSVLEEVGGRILRTGIDLGAEIIRKRYG